MVFIPAPVSPDDASRLFAAGAFAILTPASPQARQRWSVTGKTAPTLETRVSGYRFSSPEPRARIALAEASATTISQCQRVQYCGSRQIPARPSDRRRGMLWASCMGRNRQTALFSCRRTWIIWDGVSRESTADTIFNGADDNASGTAAVMELGRTDRAAWASAENGRVCGVRQRRNWSGWIEVLCGASAGSADVDRCQPADRNARPARRIIAPQTLWLTGYDRSNLGPELARRGAKIVADPRPSQNFFERSDNYTLARRGIVAHTVSSFGLHGEYHTPADEASFIDWKHMETAVSSLVAPLMWLANSDFVPAWRPGGRP